MTLCAMCILGALLHHRAPWGLTRGAIHDRDVTPQETLLASARELEATCIWSNKYLQVWQFPDKSAFAFVHSGGWGALKPHPEKPDTWVSLAYDGKPETYAPFTIRTGEAP